MKQTRYLVDTNALSKLSRRQRGSSFLRANCRLPSEVLREAHGLPDIARLKELEYPMSARILELVGEVMATVSPHDRELVDLYHVEGTADPILIAVALHARERFSEALWGEEWTIVTDDGGVRNKAADFDVDTIETTSFQALLEEHES